MAHICFIVSTYPDEKHPYAGRFFREHAEALAEAGHSVSILYPSIQAFSATRSLSAEVTCTDEGGLTVIRSRTTVLAQRFSFLNSTALQKAFDAAYALLLKKSGKPDFCLAETGFPPAVFAGQLHDKSGIPFGIFDHYSFSARMFNEHASVWPGLYAKARFRAAVSPMLQMVVRVATDFRFPVEVLPNCLSRELRHHPVVHPSPNAAFSWIWVGRNHPVKQPGLALEAIALLPENHTLTMVGLDDAASYAASLPEAVRPRVRFLEGMAAETLWPLMENHHALLCTSEMETFGMAPLEMLALGRPVVSTPCGGPEQFINEQNGIVAAGFSAVLVSDAMKRLAEHDTFRHSAASIAADARSRFSPEAFARTFTALAQL